MNLTNKAIIFATKAHEGQYRKGTDIPYITHPFAVGMLLLEANCKEEVIAAGILHDTLEDTKTFYEDLFEQFGERVADLVLAASEENKTLSWPERKQLTINELPTNDIDEIHVIVADKLHNIRSIRKDLEEQGEEIWLRFNRGKSDQYWYYSSIVKALLPRKNECILIQELENEVNLVFE